jgi:hypothetical protein
MIKKLLLVICISFTTYTSNAYQSIFGQDSTTWTILGEILDGADTYEYKTFTGLDTINGLVYHEVYFNSSLTGYIREDTVSGKVWYLTGTPQSENLIMDLSLQLNDTFMVYTPSMDSTPAVVNNVFIQNGLKHIEFNIGVFCINQSVYMTFIESIGPNCGIIYQQQPNANYSFQLLCKYTDSTQVYSNTDFNGNCYVFLTGIKEFTKQQNHIFPLPAKSDEWLNVLNETDAVESVNLYDSFGNFIRKYDSGQFIINVPAGVYFIQTINRSHNRSVSKLVVIN